MFLLMSTVLYCNIAASKATVQVKGFFSPRKAETLLEVSEGRM